MNSRHATLFLAALAASAVAAELSPGEAASLEKRFFAARKETRTLEADFTQTVSAPGLPVTSVSHGRLFYRAPDDLRIAYTEPSGELLQLDGSDFTSVRSGRQPVVRPANHASARAIGALRDILRGRRPPGEMRAVVTRQGDDYLVMLTPTAPGRMQPERIENIIEARTMNLRSMSLTLPRGTVMRFEFTAIHQDRPLPDRIFALP